MNIVNFKPVDPSSRKEIVTRKNILIAAFYGDIRGLRDAISENSLSIHSVDDVSHGTALHIAAGVGSWTCVEYLVERTEIDLFAEDVLGNTALVRAGKLGHDAIFDYLANRMFPNRRIFPSSGPGP